MNENKRAGLPTPPDPPRRTILSGMDTYLYVTDPQTDTILSINDKMKERLKFGDDMVGSVCWTVFKPDLDERCEDCPMCQLLENPDAPVVWEERDTTTGRLYRNISSLIQWPDGKVAHLLCGTDITEIKKADESQKRQLKQQEVMSAISQSFSTTRNMQDLIFDALKTAGEFMGVNHSFLSVYRKEAGYMECLSEWYDEGGKPFIGGESKWEISPEMDIYKDFTHQGYAAISDYKELKDPQFETVRDYDLRAFLNIPIEISGEFWGIIGFIINNRAYDWTESDIYLGKLIAGVFSGAVSRGIVEKNLSQAKEDAERASRSKGDFLSSMSHEIRTPMNAIIGMTQIARSADDPQKVAYCLEQIDSASKHLLNLINDILDMSKIEANKIDLSAAEFDLEKMLMNVAGVLNIKIEEKQQKVIINIEHDLPTYWIGDELRLNQVITNLLTNAVKFSPMGGTITLNIRGRDSWDGYSTLLVEVIDDGIGISEEQQDRLFEPFEQAESTTTRQYGGTGLGLPICKGIVEAMNGHIWIESELGKGTKISFTVQMKASSTPGRPKSVSDARSDTIRILAVDSAPEIRAYFRRMMAAIGLSCDVADSDATALDMIAQNKEQPYTIFFIDGTALDLGGAELARKIKHTAQDSTVILMISATEWGSMKDDTIVADHFITKPLFPSALIDVINESLGVVAVTKNALENACAYDFGGYHLLVAEDIEINREIIAAILEDTHVSLDFAVNGREALAMFEKDANRYNLILMDIQMPEMNGYEATRKIRALDTAAAKNVPIIAMTANVFQEDIERCMQVGMSGHLGKPVNMDELLLTLSKFLYAGSAMLFTEDMQTGIARIDAQHKSLVDFANRLAFLGNTNPGVAETKAFLRFLGDYVVDHFRTEEELQIESNYPRYLQHKEIHLEFVQTFMSMCVEYEQHGPSEELSKAIANKVINWIITHIKVEDVRMGKHYTQFMRQHLNERLSR